MLKTIGKAVFIAFIVIFGFIVYYMSYNSGAAANYEELVRNSQNALDLSKAFSMYNYPIDPVPVYESEGNENKVSIYRVVNGFNVAYFESEDAENAKEESNVEFMYFLFIENPTSDFARNTAKVGDSTFNETGLRFTSNSSEKAFEFKFVVESDGVNKESYIEKPLSAVDAVFGCPRNISVTYQDFNFIYTQMPETFINHITELIEGPINKIEVLDRDGNVFGEPINATLDFNDKFFSDLTEFRDDYRIYKKGQDAEGYDDAYNYLDSFKPEDLGYVCGYSKDLIYPAGLIGSSIGIVALFILAGAIVYILLFHFATIKRIVFRENKRNYAPNKNAARRVPSNKDSIKADFKEVKSEDDNK